MINTVQYCINGLKRRMDEQKYEQLVTMIVINKLYGEIRIDWERYRSVLAKSLQPKESTGENDTYLPDWNTLKLFFHDEAEFHAQFGSFTGDTNDVMSTTCDSSGIHSAKSTKLQTQALALPKANKNRYDDKQQSKPNMFCDCSFWQPIHKCNKFIAMNMNDREQYIRDRKMCAQCLQSAHMGIPCEDRKANRFCDKCKTVKHNSIITQFTTSGKREMGRELECMRLAGDQFQTYISK